MDRNMAEANQQFNSQLEQSEKEMREECDACLEVWKHAPATDYVGTRNYPNLCQECLDILKPLGEGEQPIF